jgi:hypothetical protein
VKIAARVAGIVKALKNRLRDWRWPEILTG